MAERLCENRLELLVINYFKKELRRRCFTGFKGGYVLETNFSFIVCLFVWIISKSARIYISSAPKFNHSINLTHWCSAMFPYD